MKHTAGPWEIVENSWSTTTISSGDTTIAVLSCEDVATEDNQFELEAIQKANAKLIAAAPEMMDVLLQLVAPFDAAAKCGMPIGKAEITSDSQMLAKIRAAINKVTA